ncbi:MAG TPA: peptidase E [Micromonosporaceae bacterium]|jgi:peptidase E
MPEPIRQIFAFSGVLNYDGNGKPPFMLIEHAVGLAGIEPGAPVRICYIPTAIGDQQTAIEAQTETFQTRIPGAQFSTLRLFTQPSFPDIREHLLAQDVIFVEGGSVVNLMAIWRVHGLRPILRECWEQGIVLTGVSAGSICWHLGGPTDSYSDALDPFDDGMGILPYSNGVHDDFPEQPRREIYRRYVDEGKCAPGYASEDGVGLHYIGTELHEAVTVVDGKTGWWVEPGRAVPVPTRLL